MNILLSSWLPVLLLDGSVRKVAPVEVPTCGAVRVAHPRADFSALATELLVDLFQTLAAPADRAQRRQFLRDPQSVDLSAMHANAGSFELFGSGVRFMQSPEMLGKAGPVSSLVFEAALENTAEKNTDIFVSRNAFSSVCPHCAALGLFLNQAHARQGGSGYKTSPRGGSALTVLVKGESLWETVVLNLIPQADFDARFALADAPKDVFPWSAGTGGFTAAVVEPAQAGAQAGLWWCPVALHLVAQRNGDQEPCGLCGEVHEAHVRTVYRAATKARAPEGATHPHTAYLTNAKTGQLYPLMVPKGGQRLEDWLALVLGRVQATGVASNPVPAVSLLTGSQAARLSLWTFGCSMNISTFERWHEELSPVLLAQNDQEAAVLRSEASRLLERVLRTREALFKALTTNLADKGERKQPMPLKQNKDALLARLEEVARAALLKALEHVDFETNTMPAQAAGEFEGAVAREALRLFDVNVVVNPLYVDQARRILTARAKFFSKLFPKPKKPTAKADPQPQEVCA